MDISEQFNRLPGRRCIEAVNECLDSKLNDCSEHAICEDSKERLEFSKEWLGRMGTSSEKLPSRHYAVEPSLLITASLWVP